MQRRLREHHDATTLRNRHASTCGVKFSGVNFHLYSNSVVTYVDRLEVLGVFRAVSLFGVRTAWMPHVWDFKNSVRQCALILRPPQGPILIFLVGAFSRIRSRGA